jgi:hypothetical protein
MRRRLAKYVLAFTIIAATWSWCRSPRSAQPAAPSGLLVYVQAAGAGKSTWRWIDVATRATGELGYEGSSRLSYVDDRRGVWMSYANHLGDRFPNGALHVERQGRGIATRFVADVAVAGVSPGGHRAAMIHHYPGNQEDTLDLARAEPRGFVPGESLHVPFMESTVFGWFDESTPLIGHHGDLLRATAGQQPVVLRYCDGSSYGDASHDMRWFAWATDPRDDEEQVLHIASLRDLRAPPREIALTAGQDSLCLFAPDDRTIACMVGDAYHGDVKTMLVDVQSGNVTQLGEHLPPTIAFSPDGRWLAIWDEHTTLVPVDGNWPPISLVDGGYPVAWLR